jgi:hypothetical protein
VAAQDQALSKNCFENKNKKLKLKLKANCWLCEKLLIT